MVVERLVLRHELSPRRAQGQGGGLQPSSGAGLPFYNELVSK